MANHLLSQRHRFSKALADEEALLSRLCTEKRDPTREERDCLLELTREKNRACEMIERLEKTSEDRALCDSPAHPESPSITVVRNEGESPRRTNGKKSYRSIFGSPANGDFGFRNLSEMAIVVRSGRSDERLVRAAHGASGLTGADGGYLIPDILAVELFQSVLESSVVLSRCQVVAMPNGNRKVASLNGDDRSGGNVYGFTAEWANEAGAFNLQKPVFKYIHLAAKKLGILSAASNELLMDAAVSGDSDFMGQALSKAMTWALDRSLLVAGTGSGQPLSVLNAPSKIEVAKTLSQPADTITFANLSNMMGKLAPEFEKTAIWVASPSCKPQLLQTSITLITDVSAAFVPALTMENGKWMLLGRECVFSEHLPVLGDAGDIILCDLGAYVAGITKELTVDRSEHVYFYSDETDFRSVIRIDAQPKLGSKITASNGEQLSWCISLAERAAG